MLGLMGLFLVVLLPQSALASRLYIDPADALYNAGDTFIASIHVDNEGGCINVVEATVQYDPRYLKAIDFSQGHSLITLWVESPSINQKEGTISFAGGIPGGYCGRITGDPGLSNILGEIVFVTLGSDTGEGTTTSVTIQPDAKVLLNDGRGTPAEVSVEGALLSVGKPGPIAVNEWAQLLASDVVPPENFTILLDEGIVPNKRAIVFATIDKQSGIDHYEIFETDPSLTGYDVETGDQVYWTRGTSPYVLKDQQLRSRILVKAVDKAGNEQLAEYLPEGIVVKQPSTGIDLQVIALTALLVLTIAAIMWRFISLRRRDEEVSYEPVFEDRDHDGEPDTWREYEK
jgi:hypothetical protein